MFVKFEFDNIQNFSRIIHPSVSLHKIADLVKQGVEKALYTGTTYRGSPVKPLAQSTIKRKKHSRPFYYTGKLFKAVRSKKISKYEYEIFIDAPRTQIASWLHFGTKRIPARPFFGIYYEIEKALDKNIFDLLNFKID